MTQFYFFRCLETEDEEAVTPCSVALLGVQMGKALRRMTQNTAQLLLVGIRQQHYCKRKKTPHTASCAPTVYYPPLIVDLTLIIEICENANWT